jgi:ABC-type dipeptide/oligopeptide/nickel transport system permease component
VALDGRDGQVQRRAPALVALPSAWMGVVSLSFFSAVAPWVDTARALGPMHEEVLSSTQWAHAATALAIWMALPLAIGAWRVIRCEVTA